MVRRTVTDDAGQYQIVGVPVGNYRLEVRGQGFQTQVLRVLTLEVARTVTQNFQLQVGDISQTVSIVTNSELIDTSTTSVGHVVDQRMVRELPLNGRYFLDLGLLVPGTVTPPQGAFSSAPIRGLGSFAITTAGNREETVNYVINGITLNNLTFSSIAFQPSIGTVQESKVDNSTFSAAYGQSSGAVVNIATRSGTSTFHGEAFEFLRNDAFDARNFFTFTASEPPPFKRNQFGGQLGGPILKDKLFFFFSYEGLRQRQQVDLNSLVLSDAQRVATTDPIILRLIGLIPRANFVDSSGTPRFVGSASARVDGDQWTGDTSYNIRNRDRLHGYYDVYQTDIVEPNRNGNTVPGFGNRSRLNGERRCYESRMARTGNDILSVVRNITQAKKSQSALRESESRLRLAQQAARVGTWEWNVRTGEAVWSEMIWTLLGLKPGDGLTNLDRFVDFIHPDDREGALRKVNEALAKGGDYYDEFRIVRRDGKMLWLSSKGRVFLGPDGQAERMIGVNIDINERRQAEETAREAKEKDRAILHAIPDLMFLQTQRWGLSRLSCKRSERFAPATRGVFGQEHARDPAP